MRAPTGRRRGIGLGTTGVRPTSAIWLAGDVDLQSHVLLVNLFTRARMRTTHSTHVFLFGAHARTCTRIYARTQLFSGTRARARAHTRAARAHAAQVSTRTRLLPGSLPAHSPLSRRFSPPRRELRARLLTRSLPARSPLSRRHFSSPSFLSLRSSPRHGIILYTQQARKRQSHSGSVEVGHRAGYRVSIKCDRTCGESC